VWLIWHLTIWLTINVDLEERDRVGRRRLCTGYKSEVRFVTTTYPMSSGITVTLGYADVRPSPPVRGPRHPSLGNSLPRGNPRRVLDGNSVWNAILRDRPHEEIFARSCWSLLEKLPCLARIANPF
jgi:hypothetical protein